MPSEHRGTMTEGDSGEREARNLEGTWENGRMRERRKNKEAKDTRKKHRATGCWWLDIVG